MMFEDLMHLTASLDLRAQSERCVSTIIFYACASSGVAGGGYAAAICGRAPLEKVRQAHTGPSTRSVRDMRMSEKVAPTTLIRGSFEQWPYTSAHGRICVLEGQRDLMPPPRRVAPS